MNKPKKPNIRQTDWSEFESRCPWGCVVSTREVARILGTSLPNIHSWVIRGHLPEPEPRSRLLPAGNRRYWRIDRLRSFLENRPVEEIHREWCRVHIDPIFGKEIEPEYAESIVSMAYKIYEWAKPILPGNFK